MRLLIDFEKAFRQITSAKKETHKTRRNVKTFSRNARRMFAQLSRKKGQLVSHFLDQMANVTGIDDKSRKHYELRGNFNNNKKNKRENNNHQNLSSLLQVFSFCHSIIVHL